MRKKCFSLVLALVLCLTLCLGLWSAAAAETAEFPTPDKTTNGVWTTSEFITGLKKSSMIGWHAAESTTKDDLMAATKDYIHALVDTGDFEVVRDIEEEYNYPGIGGFWSADLRYTGSAAMSGSMRDKRDDKTWPSYGQYHITVAAMWSDKNYGNRKATLCVTWDISLTPYTLKDAQKPEPTPEPKVSTSPKPVVISEPEVSSKPSPAPQISAAPEPTADTTVVLKLNFNQMVCNSDVLPVDTASDAVTPVAENNRTLVPVSRIVDAFGGKSTWEASTNKTTYTLGNKTVSHVIGTNTITSGAKTIQMDVCSKAMNNRTYMPVRFLLEALGLWVGYEPDHQMVVVSTEAQDSNQLKALAPCKLLMQKCGVIPPATNIPSDGSAVIPDFGKFLNCVINEDIPVENSHIYSYYFSYPAGKRDELEKKIVELMASGDYPFRRTNYSETDYAQWQGNLYHRYDYVYTGSGTVGQYKSEDFNLRLSFMYGYANEEALLTINIGSGITLADSGKKLSGLSVTDISENAGSGSVESSTNTNTNTNTGTGRKRCTWCQGGTVRCGHCINGTERCSKCSGNKGKWEYVSSPNYSGTDTTTSRRWVECTKCQGKGTVDCRWCGGDKRVECSHCGGDGWLD